MPITTVTKDVDPSITVLWETTLKRGGGKPFYIVTYGIHVNIMLYFKKQKEKKKKTIILKIFPKSGFNKDPRGRILGSVKKDGHVLNACDIWYLFSSMK